MSGTQSSVQSLFKRWSKAICAASHRVYKEISEIEINWKFAAILLCAATIGNVATLGLTPGTACGAAKYKFSTLNNAYKAQSDTLFFMGMNKNRQIVGRYGYFPSVRQSFLITDGKWSKIAPPNALETYVGGINNNGIVVGYSDIDNVGVKAFVLSKKGAYSFPASQTGLEFWAVNDINLIAGHNANLNEDFIFDLKTKTYTKIPAKQKCGSGEFLIRGMTNDKIILGKDYGGQGYLYDINDKTCAAIPGNFVAEGINNTGQVSGWCGDDNGTHGCFYDYKKKTWTRFDDPLNKPANGGTTHAYKINDNKELVGESYNYDTGFARFFLAAPATETPPPVIVLHGIAGSMSTCLFVDPASGDTCPDHLDFEYLPLIYAHLTPAWVLDPTRNHTYHSLVQELRNSGRVLYPMPYDWREPNQNTARTTLTKLIERAKKATGADKVDVVAHSMGGLIIRYYIEELGNSDVRKLVMLGTPNRGSASAYYSWEGGDFSESGFFAEIFFNRIMNAMRAGYNRRNMPNHEFVRYAVPSLRQLLPSTSYLLRDKKGTFVSVPITDMRWKNNLIPYLDYNTLIKNIGINNILIFAGNSQQTIGSIEVKEPIANARRWADGEPTDKINVHGDGTVAVVRARLGQIETRLEDSEHIDLPDHCRANVIRFLNDQPLQQTQLSPEKLTARKERIIQAQSIENELFIGTHNNISMGLTTPDGQRLGNFSLEGKSGTKLPSHLYLGNKERTIALGIDNPNTGEYVLEITTQKLQTDYKISVSYKDKKGENKLTIEGAINRGDTKSHSFKINQDLEMR